MKRKNYKRKQISYLVIGSVVLGSLLFSSSDNIVVSASAVPEIQIVTPEDGAAFNASLAEFTGTISDDLTTADKLTVKVFEELEASQQPIDITDEGKLTVTPKDNVADFSYSKEFSEGDHTVTFVVTDEEGVSAKVDRSITIKSEGTDTTESIENTPTPVDDVDIPITSTDKKAVIEETPPETDVSVASTNEKVTSKVTIEEAGPRPYMAKMYLIPKGDADKYEPGKDVPNSFLSMEDMTRVPLNYVILVDVRCTEPLTKTQPLLTSFGDIKGDENLIATTALTDDLKSYVYTFTPDQDFKPGTSYFVYLNPKFSTEKDEKKVIIPRFLKFTTVSDYKDTEFQVDRVADETTDNDAIHGPFSVVTNACAFCHSTHNGTNEFLIKGEKGSTENDMCMACHDGTGSPKIEENNSHSQHYSSVSCSSCHDPHTPGTKHNPNSMLPKSGTDPFYNYKKAGNATGVISDYSLCFKCHGNGSKTDIEQYYTDGTSKSQSGHNIQAATDTGISLNGQLPCAECHETHGATNIKMLRPELGNMKPEAPKPESDQLDDNWFNKTTSDWDAEAQRKFCLSCHNGKTDLYGKQGKAIYDKETGNPINPANDGHDRESQKTCAECHSDSKSFIDTAHAPKRITP